VGVFLVLLLLSELLIGDEAVGHDLLECCWLSKKAVSLCLCLGDVCAQILQDDASDLSRREALNPGVVCLGGRLYLCEVRLCPCIDALTHRVDPLLVLCEAQVKQAAGEDGVGGAEAWLVGVV